MKQFRQSMKRRAERVFSLICRIVCFFLLACPGGLGGGAPQQDRGSGGGALSEEKNKYIYIYIYISGFSRIDTFYVYFLWVLQVNFMFKKGSGKRRVTPIKSSRKSNDKNDKVLSMGWGRTRPSPVCFFAKMRCP